ncbi:hypothetical protein ADIARSV_2773 [Arcticibacter svalbardensis MN12-7]|uniref:MalT-like TPR region domain-containing protein n=1 Tax=Arcticibacter svalbardensis MN12-7 TaxID=1150600 RepID=R9GQE9_9SPHI|nr:hypothetical protein [Arcticibacter svalbardensis]EOR94057.1 hypothetical protein ADIARSV_2773 [Arcticibacter svalbardensis MN12-7]
MKILYLALALLLFYSTSASASNYADTLELVPAEITPSQPPEASIKTLRDSISTLNHDVDMVQEGNLRMGIAQVMFKQSLNKQAIHELVTAEMLFHKAGDSEQRENVIAQIATYYRKNNDLIEAEKYYMLLLQVQEIQKEYGKAGKTANMLIAVLLKRKDVQKAAGYISSLPTNKYDVINEKSTLADAYVKLAEIRRIQTRYKQAASLILQNALSLYRSADNLNGRIGCFDLLGRIYFAQKRYSEAKWFFIQANTQSRNLDNQKGIITSLVNLSKVKIAIHHNKLALRDLKEASTLAVRLNNLTMIANVKKGYSYYYASTGSKSASQASRSRSN